MNAKRLITTLLLTVITVSGTAILLNSALAADGPFESAESQNGSSSSSRAEPVKVKTLKAAKNHLSAIELAGTVKANDQVRVFATSAGQISKILASEGEQVKKGDPLFVIGGVNGTKPVALIQLEIAQKNHETAKRGLEITEQGSLASLRAAELQLESARHAMQGAEIDLQVIDRNIGAVNNGLFYLNDSLNATAANNDLSLQKARNGLDSLKDAIRSLEDKKASPENQDYDSHDDPAQNPIETSAQVAELDKAIEELYAQLESARIGYKQLEQAKTLTENQVLAQISQTETQWMTLNLNRTGAETRMGLMNGASDAVRLAEEGVNGAIIKNRASLLQAETQLALAAANLETANILADSLVVRAPVDGVIGEIGVNAGDQVSQQTLLTQVSGLKNHELRTFVDADSADLISPGSYAEVMIAGRYVKLPVKSVGAFADPATKLVGVSIALPNTGFRANRSLKVRLTLEHGNSALDADSYFIPLDALIIGTEETYVFTSNEGVARRQVVKTGEVRGDTVEIISGLNEDDLIITEGSKKVLENQPVAISE